MPCALLGDHNPISILRIPLFLERVSAGFPSPAVDYVEKTLDLNELCIQHPATTFFVRVQGESMTEAGIFPGDVLVVDQSPSPTWGYHHRQPGNRDDGETAAFVASACPAFLPRNPGYKPIIIGDDMVLEVFGVVTNVVRSFNRRGLS